MDIHIKLIINDRCQEKDLDIEYMKKNSVLFEFSEYDDVKICFQNLQNQVLQIDCMEKELYTVSENEILTINMRKDDRRLVPGYYCICLTTPIEKKLFFKVLPKNIEWESLLKLRDRLDGFLNGINLDYNSYYSSNEDESKSNVDDRYIEEYLGWCRVRENISSLLKKPSQKLIKKYGYSNRLTKIDSRVIRKQQNGQCVDKYWQPKLKINYNTNDNFALIEALEESIYDNYNIENLLISRKTKYINEKNDLENEMHEVKKSFEKIVNDNIITGNFKKSIQNRLVYLRKNICKKERIIENTEENIEIIRRIIKEKLELSYFIKKDMEIIKPNIKDLKIKDNRYKVVIEQLKKKSNQFTNKMNHDKKNGFSFKKTEILFEYFCLFRIINELFNAQYICMSEWLTEAIKDNYLTEIPSSKDIVFKKNNQEIIIQYDKEMPIRRMVLGTKYEGIYSVNSQHRRPDISLIIKNNNIIESVLIFEVKYRGSKYIYKKDGDTEVTETLNDYSQLNYYLNYKRITGVVKKVVLLYPYQKNIIKANDDMIEYIPININENICEEEIINILSDYGITFD